MLDYLRRQDPLTRDHRQSVTEKRASQPIHLNLTQFPDLEPPAPYPDPLAQIERSQRIETIRRARAALTSREQEVLSLLIDEGLTGLEVATRLGVTDFRIWQVRRSAVEKLAKAVAANSIHPRRSRSG